MSTRKEQRFPLFSMANKPLGPSLAFFIKVRYPKFSNTSCNPFMRVRCWVILFGFTLPVGEVFLYVKGTF